MSAPTTERRTGASCALPLALAVLLSACSPSHPAPRPGEEVPSAGARKDQQRLAALFSERTHPGKADYRIAPGDELAIAVFGMKEIDGAFTVDRDGSVNLPMVGTVAAAGKTEAGLAEGIAEQLRGRLIHDPSVRVAVTRFRGRRVSVLGEVARPGFYALSGDSSTILDALNLAGGLRSESVTRLHFTPEEGEARAAPGREDPIEIDLTGLQQGAPVPALGLPLRRGDTIYVTEAEQIIVEGWVEKPGSYPLRAGMTIAQALTLAGGLHFGASSGSVTLSRKSRTGPRREMSFDYDSVARGNQRDLRMQGGDRIRVGGNPVKVAAWGVYSFVAAVVSIGVGATIGF